MTGDTDSICPKMAYSPRTASSQWFRPIDLHAPLSTSIARRSIISTIGAVTQGLVRFITSVLVGRVGGPTVLGAYTTAFSSAQLIILFGPTSIGSASSKFVSRARGSAKPDETRAVAAHLAKRALQSGIALASLAFGFWVLLNHGGVVDATALAILVLGLSGYSFTRGLQYGAGQVSRATAWDIGTALIGVGGVVVALVAGFRGLVILLPLGAAYIAYGAAGWPWGARGRLSAQLRREIDGFIAVGIIGTLASAGFLNLSVLTVRITEGVASAGQYGAALALATPPSLLAASFSLVLFPSLSEAWGRGDLRGLKERTNIALELLIATMVGLFGCLILVSGLAVHLVWGSTFDAAASILPILLLAVMMNTLGVACTNALTAGSQRGMLLSASSSVMGMLIGGLSWSILAPTLGAAGVALGYLLGTFLIMIVPIVLIWRRDAHKWGRLTFKASAGLSMILALFCIEHYARLPVWWQPAFAAIFVVIWATVSASTIRRARLGRNSRFEISGTDYGWNSMRRALTIALPATAAFGPLIPGIGVLFGFRIIVVGLIALSLMSQRRPLNSSTAWTLFRVLSLVWVIAATVGFFFDSGSDTATRTFVILGFGLALCFALVEIEADGLVTLHRLQIGWVIAFLATGAIAVWELATGAHLSNFLTSAPDYVRNTTKLVSSVFGNPNGYGAFLVTAVPFLFCGFLRARQMRTRALYLILILSSALFVVACGSRLSLIAFVIQVCLFGLYIGRSHLRLFIVVGVSLSGLVFLFWSTALGWVTSTVANKYQYASPLQLLNEVSRSGMSGNTRLNLYQDGVWMIWQSGGLGLGPGGFQKALLAGSPPFPTYGTVDPHNLYLEIATQYGLLVFSLFMVWIFACLKLAVRAFRSGSAEYRVWGFTLSVAILGNAISALANSTYLNGSVNWVFMASLVVGSVVLEMKVPKVSSSTSGQSLGLAAYAADDGH